MVKERHKIRVGSTPNLKYELRDPEGNIVPVGAGTLLMRFTAPSGGTSATVTPALFSGTIAEVHYQTLAATFDNEGLWIVAIKLTKGLKVFESTVDEIHVDASQFP